MANLDKLKKLHAGNFETKVRKAGKRLIDLSSQSTTANTQSDASLLLKPAVVETHLNESMERIVDFDPHAGQSEKSRIKPRESEAIASENDSISFATEEAIINIMAIETRPPLLVVEDKVITDGRYGIENDYEHPELIEGSNLAQLEKKIKAVGSVDLVNHATFEYVGTGWLIDKNIAVTNAHVARAFMSTDKSGSWSFKSMFKRGAPAGPVNAKLNFLRQENTNPDLRREVKIIKPLFIAGNNQPDMAFFEVVPVSNLDYLEPYQGKIEKDLDIAAVGYPAWDGDRNDIDNLMGQLFGNIYGVKRFAPGEIDGILDDIIILHDCTTLGGNSGSPLLDLNSGEVVGLHYSGLYGEENRAIHADYIWGALRQIKGARVQGAELAPLAKKPVRSKRSLTRRNGYDPNFLGDGALNVPLPHLGDHSQDISLLLDGSGNELKYHHFSVLQSISRKLPRLTAVNIHGKKLGKVNASNSWHFDPRIDLAHQSGNELYKDSSVSNPLDRGHMVRRLDPCWGRKSDILKAQRDTYHYTNSAPQHLSLNRKHWVGLEDYILDAAKAEDFKISVFTGPVFRERDPVLSSKMSDVQIPQEYWKIAVMIHMDTGALSSSGYILSQGEMIKGFTEAAFVLGQFKTYQVPIRLIEKHTGYDFGVLSEVDVKRVIPETESLFSVIFNEIRTGEDIDFG